jgi:hypothetical protein
MRKINVILLLLVLFFTFSAHAGSKKKSLPAAPASATFYQNCSYGGWAAGLTIGSYKLAQLISAGATNDEISSLRVPAGLKVVLFEHENFVGSSITLTADNDCLVDEGWNNRVSSIRVESNTAPPAGDWSSFQYPTINFRNKAPNHPGSVVFNTAMPDPVADMKAQILEVVKKLHYNQKDNVRTFSKLNFYLEDYDGVAYKSGAPPEITIVVSVRHINNVYNNAGGNYTAIRDEILGILSHEGTHGYQYEPKNAGGYNQGTDFYGFIEGLADYVRIAVGLHKTQKARLGGNWKDGYTTSGFFINWLVKYKDPNFAIKFQHTARTMTTWSWDAACRSILNEGVQSLWNQYQNWLRGGGSFALPKGTEVVSMEQYGCLNKEKPVTTQADLTSYRVYADNSRGVLMISSEVETSASTVLVYGATTGKSKRTTITGNSGIVDISTLSAGIYIVNITDDQGRVYQQKVLLQK